MIKKWILSELSEEQITIQEKLAQELNISPILTKMLVQRGIETFEEARSFFRPSLSDLHDPFLMKDMDKAVERLNYAMRQNEKIIIYGDYDVDGTTSVVLVYKFLKKFYPHLDFYIPSRYTEGYGVSIQGIDYACENGVTLIIALDCGIKDVGKVAYAKSKGIDFIICDHHTADEVLPPAAAVLDPKRFDCSYPFTELSGCGVGFKFMQAFAIVNNIEFKELIPLLELVVLSIASDIVPIVDENRIMAHYGLKQINENPSVAIKSLIDVCKIGERVLTISDIVFKIGPRINASGRMKSALEVVKLFISNDSTFTKEKSDEINAYNNDRKNLDRDITEKAIQHIESNEVYRNRKSVVVYDPNWHKGVVGIVASRLTEQYYKPTIVLTMSNGLVSGSARSVADFNIYDAIDSCSDLLETFGGHLYAAGLSLLEKNVPEFIERFEKYVSERIQPEQTFPKINIDTLVDFKELNSKFFRILLQFAPFGPGNMKPIFATKSIRDAGYSRVVGKMKEHLKMTVSDNSSSCVMNGIAFNMGHHYDYLQSNNNLDICYTLEENTIYGNTAMQLMVRDIKSKDDFGLIP